LATHTQDSVHDDAPQYPEPASGPSLLQALARRWWLVLLPALALLAVAVAIGVTRSPTYTATTQSNVGSIDARTQALPGFVEGAKSLASAYSRIVESDRIVRAAGARAGLSAPTVRDRLSATPVPGSPIVTIAATGPTSDDAARLATAATSELDTYVKSLEGASSRAADLLRQYRERTSSANRLDAQYERLRSQRQDDAGAVSASRLADVKTRADTDRLRAQTLGQMYTEARSQDQGAAQINLLKGATEATSDRKSVLQRLAFVGLFGGAAIGVGLVALGEGRRRRRHRLPAR
jgi:uncharacterized protein involved in exopolysaccharide biosynthesis